MGKTADKRLTASHRALYICLAIALSATLAGIALVFFLTFAEMYEMAVETITSLFGFSGVFAVTATTVIEFKSRTENEIKLNNAKYEARVNAAGDLAVRLSLGDIDEKAVALFKTLISDTDENKNASFEKEAG